MKAFDDFTFDNFTNLFTCPKLNQQQLIHSPLIFFNFQAHFTTQTFYFPSKMEIAQLIK